MTLLSFTRRWNNNEIAERIRGNTSYYTKGTKGDITTTLRYCHHHRHCTTRAATTTITKKDRRHVTNNKSKKNNEKKEKKMNSIVNVITGLAFFYEINFDQQISLLALIDFFRSLVVLIICSS